jgi:aspartyl protease family protein
MGGTDHDDVNRNLDKKGGDSRYNPTAFRWMQCGHETGQQRHQNWWKAGWLKDGPEALELVDTPWFKSWIKPLLLSLLMGIAAHQAIKFLQVMPVKQAEAGHIAQMDREQRRPAEIETVERTYLIPHAREPQAFSTTPQAPSGSRSSVIVKDKVTVLYASKNGKYFSSGSVNGLPVDFLLDSAADKMTISVDTAVRAGIRQCTPMTLHTEDGQTSVCKAVIPMIEFGGYQVRNVEVTISDKIRSHPLLGMNVLRLFNIRQHGSRLFFSLAS